MAFLKSSLAGNKYESMETPFCYVFCNLKLEREIERPYWFYNISNKDKSVLSWFTFSTPLIWEPWVPLSRLLFSFGVLSTPSKCLFAILTLCTSSSFLIYLRIADRPRHSTRRLNLNPKYIGWWWTWKQSLSLPACNAMVTSMTQNMGAKVNIRK